MSRRNMFKIVAEAEIPEHWDLNLEELDPYLFRARTKRGALYALWDIYKYGFALGRRYEKSRQRRKA